MGKNYMQYMLQGPLMDRSIPENTVKPGTLGYLAGVDGRFTGSLRRFPGLKQLTSLNTSGAKVLWAQGVSFLQSVGSDARYKGFAVHLDNQQLLLHYTLDGGDNWSTYEIASDVSVNTAVISADSFRNFLYVMAEGHEPLVTWHNGAGLTTAVMGPGDYADPDNLPTLTEESLDDEVEGFWLRSGGFYRVCYRLYSSERGIFTVMSDPIDVEVPDVPEGFNPEEDTAPDYWRLTVKIGEGIDTSVWDKVQIFRSIDLGGPGAGAHFYLDTEDDASATTAQYDVGRIMDTALPLQTDYDPNLDYAVAVPESGTMAILQGITYVADPVTSGTFNVQYSSPRQDSPEYFTTYNKREGSATEGRILRFMQASDSVYGVGSKTLLRIARTSPTQNIQIESLHLNRGILGPYMVHAAGNALFLLTGMGLVIFDGSSGDMGQVTAADRIFKDRWSDQSKVSAAYDSRMNASFFLHPQRREAVQLYHSSHSVGMLEGMAFEFACSGDSIDDPAVTQAWFFTDDGRIMTPDPTSTSGNMYGLDDQLKLNSTVTDTSREYIADSENTQLPSAVVGAMVYMTTGVNTGVGRRITEVDINGHLQLESDFPEENRLGDRYAIAPVVFKARLWRVSSVQTEGDNGRFRRWNVHSVALKMRKIQGMGDDNPNNRFRVGFYRNSDQDDRIYSPAYVAPGENPAEAIAAVAVDGIDLEPYIEQISSGTLFELTDAEVGVTISTSRTVNN